MGSGRETGRERGVARLCVGVWGACHHVCTCADAGEKGQSNKLQCIIKLGYGVLL